jgi:hypothetical protein
MCALAAGRPSVAGSGSTVPQPVTYACNVAVTMGATVTEASVSGSAGGASAGFPLHAGNAAAEITTSSALI